MMLFVNVSDSKATDYNRDIHCQLSIENVYLLIIIAVESFLLLFSLSFSIGICCKRLTRKSVSSFEPPLQNRMNEYSSTDTIPRLVVYESLGERDQSVANENENTYETFQCDKHVYANECMFRKNMVFSIYANHVTLSDAAHEDIEA